MSIHDQLRQDYDNDQSQWRPISEELWWNLLNAVPPKKFDGYRYLCGEPSFDNSNNEPVYFAGWEYGYDKYYARLLTVSEFNDRSIWKALS